MVLLGIETNSDGVPIKRRTGFRKIQREPRTMCDPPGNVGRSLLETGEGQGEREMETSSIFERLARFKRIIKVELPRWPPLRYTRSRVTHTPRFSCETYVDHKNKTTRSTIYTFRRCRTFRVRLSKVYYFFTDVGRTYIDDDFRLFPSVFSFGPDNSSATRRTDDIFSWTLDGALSLANEQTRPVFRTRVVPFNVLRVKINETGGRT